MQALAKQSLRTALILATVGSSLVACSRDTAQSRTGEGLPCSDRRQVGVVHVRDATLTNP